MRLHSLELSAFLAYGGTASVNFEHLTESGFFLIHGETGAGKTTLLDAIAFAIYGRLPGARDSVKTIRSDHADAATPTRVVLDASVGGTRLRITRSPRYERPKRKGTGTTVEAARVAVERHTGYGWEPWTTSADEAGSALRAWIGLDADQFFRLVLIPQGAFAAFLHASSKERSRLLAELFRDDLVVYQRVQDWCREQLAAASSARDAALVALAKERARVAQVIGVDDDDDGIDLAVIDERLEGIEREISAVDAERVEAATVLAAARDAQQVAEQQVRDSERWQLANAALERATQDLAAVRLSHPALGDVADDALESHLESLERDAAEQLRRMQAAADARTQVLAARASVALAQQRLTQADEQLTSLAQRRGGIDAEVERLTRARDDGRTAAEERAGVAEERTVLDAHVKTAGRRDAAADALATATAAHVAAVDAHDAAVRALEALRIASTASQAALLAAALLAGTPCPVCGALEHPHPHPMAEAIDPESLRAAEEQMLAATAAREQCAATLAGAAVRLAELRVDLGAYADVDTARLEELRAGLKAREAALLVRSKAADAADHALREATAERDRLDGQQATLAAQREDAAADFASAKAALVSQAAASGMGVDEDLPDIDLEPQRRALVSLQRLRSQVRDLVGALREAMGALAAVDAGGVADLPDLTVLAAAVTAAEERVTACEATALSLRTIRDGLLQRRPVFVGAIEEAVRAEAARARFAALAHPVNGRGPGRTLLTDYYLAARLRQVLDRANGRLLRMTDNRFTFVFDAEARGSGYRSLEIAVHDAWSGSARPVESLSGGETFTASLALALGLADIVEAEAGGRALDSLFIDEGFGTLSADYLHRVMQDLDRLRASGRLVGVISHVPELRQRIPMQLQVTRGVNGSSVTLVDADTLG